MSSDEVGDYQAWANEHRAGSAAFGDTGAIIKDGRRVRKTVTLAKYGSPQTGEVKKRELRFHTFEKSANSKESSFELNSKNTWWCENDEIDRVLSFLQSEFATSGQYKMIEKRSGIASLLDALNGQNVDLEQLAYAISDSGNTGRIIQLLASSGVGLSAAEGAIISARREKVAKLQRIACSRNGTESDIQRLIGDDYWIFGGSYVGVARRSILPLDQYDIPLLEADGTLHIVELKGPVIPRLVRRHRNHPIVGNEVHEAISQAMNYLRSADELGASVSTQYRNDTGLDFDLRRVFATVVIGHPSHVGEFDERTVKQTIRSYNAHLSRVRVITYKELGEMAEQALSFQARELKPSE